MMNMGNSRQKASADAHAAYLNAIRWYVSGDEAYARCAVNICNAWSETVNQIPKAKARPGFIRHTHQRVCHGCRGVEGLSFVEKGRF